MTDERPEARRKRARHAVAQEAVWGLSGVACLALSFVVLTCAVLLRLWWLLLLCLALTVAGVQFLLWSRQWMAVARRNGYVYERHKHRLLK